MDEKSRAGHLEVIFGPMFSGKTSELIRRVHRYELCNYKCLIVRYARDNRYSASDVSTHDGFKIPAVSANKLEEVEYLFHSDSPPDLVGIDEGQFFPDIVEFCKRRLSSGKISIVAGLDGTFQKTGFGEVLKLVPLAKTVDKLSAVCMSCGAKASFTRRLGNEKEVEVIGGADKYMAVCRECYKLDSPRTATPFKDLDKPQYFKPDNEDPVVRTLFQPDKAITIP